MEEFYKVKFMTSEMTRMRRATNIALLICVAAIGGCALQPQAIVEDAQDAQDALPASRWAATSALPGDTKSGPWEHYQLPTKTPSRYDGFVKDGREALAVSAQSSASMVRRRVRVEPDDLGSVKFSWQVPELIASADMALREADDSPVRLVLTFEGDRANFSAKNAMLSELAQVLTGEPLPYATLMYVWCNKRQSDSVIINPRTDRIRTLVVESGSKNLNRWLDYERNIRPDFETAFGEAPGALVGVALMTDTDNTRSSAQAWYGPLSFSKSDKRVLKSQSAVQIN